MEEEKKADEIKTEEKKTGDNAAPIVTRSMVEEACPTCGAQEPSMPAVLPDPSWSTEKLIAATKDKHMLVGMMRLTLGTSLSVEVLSVKPFLQFKGSPARPRA
jgi:hypothetical protein